MISNPSNITSRYDTDKIIVKLCGLRTIQDIDVCSQADYLGFIVDVPSSKRNLSIPQAKKLINKAKEYPLQTAVVTTSLPSAKKIATSIQPDIIQLHFVLPSHPEEVMSALEGQKYALCLGVSPEGTLNENHLDNDLGRRAEYILVESIQGNDIVGGKGKVHNWSEATKIVQSYPKKTFLVAGGISSENFSDILTKTHASGIDIASSIENVNGDKSKELVDKLFRNIYMHKKLLQECI